MGYTLKKLSRLAVQKDYAERRDFLQSWLGFYRDLHHTALVLDESHGDENVARRAMGWAPGGQKAYVFEPFKKTTTFSLLAVSNQDVFCPHMCYIAQEPVTSELFVDCFRDFVYPYLRPLGEPDGLLLLDNVSQHWDPRIREMCEDKKCHIREVFLETCVARERSQKRGAHGAHHSVSKIDCAHVFRMKTCQIVAPPPLNTAYMRDWSSCVARSRPASTSCIATL